MACLLKPGRCCAPSWGFPKKRRTHPRPPTPRRQKSRAGEACESKRQTPRSRRGKSQAVEALGLSYLHRYAILIANLQRRIGDWNPGFGRELGRGLQYPGRVGGPKDHWALAVGAEL